MFPIDVPAGTTLDSLVTEVVPRIHGELVQTTAADEHTIVVELRGHKTWTLVVCGGGMRVREGAATAPGIFVSFDAEVAQRFLDDWTGEKKYLPKSAPAGELVLLTDPRVLKRLMMASGSIELAITDFEGERIAMVAAFGPAAKKTVDVDDADVVVEAKMGVLQALMDARIAPDAILSSGDVKTKGNRFLAMQLALAVAPFFPVGR